MNQTQLFQIGHVAVSVYADQINLFSRICTVLKDFKVDENHKPSEAIIKLTLLHMDTDEHIPYEIPEKAVFFHESETARHYTYRQLWIVDYKRMGRMIINRSNLKILGYVYTHYALASRWHFEDYLHPMYELMRMMGLYAHHAGAVCSRGFGLLIPGKSGQGKSTLSVHLMKKGFTFLSDDRCFVRKDNDQFQTIGLYEPAKLFPSNIDHLDIEHLQESATDLDLDVRNKHSLDIKSLYPEKVSQTSPLRGIVFPQWSPGEKSRLEKITPGKALLALLPLTLVCFDKATSETHFHFLSDLVAEIPARRLIMGDDRECWHQLVKEFIAHPSNTEEPTCQ